MPETQSYAYIGRKPCGCVTSAIAVAPETLKRIPKFIMDLVKNGVKVEHVTVEYVRENLRQCKCDNQKDLIK